MREEWRLTVELTEDGERDEIARILWALYTRYVKWNCLDYLQWKLTKKREAQSHIERRAEEVIITVLILRCTGRWWEARETGATSKAWGGWQSNAEHIIVEITRRVCWGCVSVDWASRWHPRGGDRFVDVERLWSWSWGSWSSWSPLFLIVNEVASLSVCTETSCVESAAVLGLVSWVTVEGTEFLTSMGELTLWSVSALSCFFKGSAHLGLIATELDLLGPFRLHTIPSLYGDTGWLWERRVRHGHSLLLHL